MAVRRYRQTVQSYLLPMVECTVLTVIEVAAAMRVSRKSLG